MSFILDLDLATARADEKHDVAAGAIVVLSRTDAFQLRVGKLTADLVPAVAGLKFERDSDQPIPSIWVTNTAGVGTSRLMVTA